MDIQTLTLGEVAKIEEISGLPLSAMADEDKPKGKQMAAIAFVVMRRGNPAFTMKEAESMTFAEVTALLSQAKK